MRFTLGRNSARTHWCRAITHDSAKPASKPGSLSPQHKFRRRRKRRSTGQYKRRTEMRQSSERLVYAIPKTSFGAVISYVWHAAGTGGQGDGTHVERPDKPS